MKNTKIVILFVMLLLGGFAWKGCIDKSDNIILSVHASGNASKAKKAYKTILEQIANKGKYEGITVAPSDITFYIKDLTGDGVPEMLLCQNMTYPSEQVIYTYQKGKVRKLKSMNWYSGGELRTLYPKKHIIKASQSDDTGKAVVYYYKVTQSKVTVAAKGVGSMDNSGRIVLSKYYRNGKKTTKQKYLSYVQGLNKSKKLSVTNGKDVVFHSNTEGNRGKYLTNRKQGKLNAPKMGKWKKVYGNWSKEGMQTIQDICQSWF